MKFKNINIVLLALVAVCNLGCANIESLGAKTGGLLTGNADHNGEFVPLVHPGECTVTVDVNQGNRAFIRIGSVYLYQYDGAIKNGFSILWALEYEDVKNFSPTRGNMRKRFSGKNIFKVHAIGYRERIYHLLRASPDGFTPTAVVGTKNSIVPIAIEYLVHKKNAQLYKSKKCMLSTSMNGRTFYFRNMP